MKNTGRERHTGREPQVSDKNKLNILIPQHTTCEQAASLGQQVSRAVAPGAIQRPFASLSHETSHASYPDLRKGFPKGQHRNHRN